jgi:ligand-binding sensor protein
MKPSFHDLVDIDELQSLCEIFSKLTGFVTAILDMEGNVLVATCWQEICTEFHRKNPETAEACRESDTVLGELPYPSRNTAQLSRMRHSESSAPRLTASLSA